MHPLYGALPVPHVPCGASTRCTLSMVLCLCRMYHAVRVPDAPSLWCSACAACTMQCEYPMHPLYGALPVPHVPCCASTRCTLSTVLCLCRMYHAVQVPDAPSLWCSACAACTMRCESHAVMWTFIDAPWSQRVLDPLGGFPFYLKMVGHFIALTVYCSNCPSVLLL